MLNKSIEIEGSDVEFMVQILKTEDGSGKLNLETIDEGLSMILTSDHETHASPNRRSQNNSMLKNSIKQSDS